MYQRVSKDIGYTSVASENERERDIDTGTKSDKDLGLVSVMNVRYARDKY